MNLEQIDALSFTIHIILLGVKMWATWVILGWFMFTRSTITSKIMIQYTPLHVALLTFSVAMVVYEIYFIYSFFEDLILPYYEYLAMMDEIVFTLIAINYLMKEGHKNGN